jgi:hypothetical protein
VRQGVLATREFGHGDAPFGEQGDQGVLHLGQAAGDLLDAGDRAPRHGGEHGRGHERLPAGALGEQQGVVPAVLELVLGGARGALDDQAAGAADRGRQQLGEHRLGGAGLADEQQAALPGEGDDAAFHQGAVADELALDDEAARHALGHLGVVGQAQRPAVAAHDEGDDGTRGEPPGGRARSAVVGGEEGELGGVPVLGRGDLPRGGGGGGGGHRRRPFRVARVVSSSKAGASPARTRSHARANSSGTGSIGTTAAWSRTG